MSCAALAALACVACGQDATDAGAPPDAPVPAEALKPVATQNQFFSPDGRWVFNSSCCIGVVSETVVVGPLQDYELLCAAWSPDSRYIAYFPLSDDPAKHTDLVCLCPTDESAPPVRIALDLTDTWAGWKVERILGWSRDGTEVLLAARALASVPEGAYWALVAIRVPGGEVRQLFSGKYDTDVYSFAASPSGRWLAKVWGPQRVSLEDRLDASLLLIDVADPAKSQKFALPWNYETGTPVAWLPDERGVLVFTNEFGGGIGAHVVELSREGSVVAWQRVSDYALASAGSCFTLSSDGRWLLYRSRLIDMGTPPAVAKARVVEWSADNSLGVALSPDGKWALSRGFPDPPEASRYGDVTLHGLPGDAVTRLCGGGLGSPLEWAADSRSAAMVTWVDGPEVTAGNGRAFVRVVWPETRCCKRYTVEMRGDVATLKVDELKP